MTTFFKAAAYGPALLTRRLKVRPRVGKVQWPQSLGRLTGTVAKLRSQTLVFELRGRRPGLE